MKNCFEPNVNSRLIKNMAAVAVFFGATALTNLGAKVSFAQDSQEQTAEKESQHNPDFELINWEDLLPMEDFNALSAGPSLDLAAEGSADDSIASPLKNSIAKPRDAFEEAMVSVKVVEEFNEKKIRLPGFIVPIDVQGEGVTKEFFFVPFFGACLHVPPPPPNQIIYAKYPKGLEVSFLYEPYYIEATLYTKQTENDLAASAYFADVANAFPY